MGPGKTIVPSGKTVAIVDGYRAGRLLAEHCHAAGDRLVHVRSSTALPTRFAGRWDASHYERRFEYAGSAFPLVDSLRTAGVDVVIAGDASGTRLADTLAEHLGVTNNDTYSSFARNNTYAFAADLQNRKLRGSETCITDQPSIAARIAGAGNPVVIKPLDDYGGRGVFICRTPGEAALAVWAVTGTPTTTGKTNHFALVEPFFSGDEYACNSVIQNGHIFLTGWWRCHRKFQDGRSLPDYDALIDPSQLDVALSLALPNAIGNTISAMNVYYGPTHMKIKVHGAASNTISIGTHLHPYHSGIERLCTDRDPLTLSRAAFLYPEANIPLAAEYTLHRHANIVFLRGQGTGVVRTESLQRVRDLPGVHSAELYLREGQPAPLTVDANTLLGAVTIVHPDADVVASTRLRIREFEAQGWFEG